MKHRLPANPDSIADGQLAQLAQGGDLAAFELLVQRYQRPLASFLQFFGTSTDDIEDVGQEAFLQAYLHLDQFDTQRSFKTWLYTIARRLLSRTSRQARRPRAVLPITDILEDRHAGPAHSAESSEQQVSLWQIIRGVTNDTEFLLIWLQYAECLSIAEIAEVFELSAAACKMRLSRLRDRLRPHLTPFASDPRFEHVPVTYPSRAA